MEAGGPSDGDLVAACRRNEPGAWDALVERFSRYVWAIAIQGFRLSQADAEDVVQETFVKAYEHLPKLRDAEAVRGWLGQMARNLSLDRIRAGRREDVTEDFADVADDDRIATLEQAMDLREALAGLPEHCQEIIDRFFTRDQTYEVIASELQIPSGTIASRISRCLKRLRTAFAGQGVTSA